MACFKICIRSRRKDGLYPVYIRITHNRQIGYIKTDKCVNPRNIKKGEIIDPIILSHCSKEILRYNDSLNSVDLSGLSVSEVILFLKKIDEEISFSAYARIFIKKMASEWGMERNSKTYRLAVQSFETSMSNSNILISQITVKAIQEWINALSRNTHRAKEQYPVCIKVMYRAAMEDYNDYEKGIIKIKKDPFRKISIPKADTPEKRAVEIDLLQRFFFGSLPPSNMAAPLPELSRDVAELVFCLAGINTADLYEMKKDNLRGNLLCYQRLKTKKFRNDGAYTEIRIPERLLPLFAKYKSDNEYLFSFNRRHQDLNCFNINVNRGLKPYCKHNNLPPLCIYSFRHSWATIAQNVCKATTEEVGFALNHASAHRITRGYIRTDYSPISELNDRVISTVFKSYI